jgi:hypothetical protein
MKIIGKLFKELYSIKPNSASAILIIIFLPNGISGFIFEEPIAINIIINTIYLLVATIEIFLLSGIKKYYKILTLVRFLEFSFAVFATICEILGYNVNSDRFILPIIQLSLLSIMIYNDKVMRHGK